MTQTNQGKKNNPMITNGNLYNLAMTNVKLNAPIKLIPNFSWEDKFRSSASFWQHTVPNAGTETTENILYSFGLYREKIE